MQPLPATGLVAFVKRACPTCELVEPALRRAAAECAALTFVSQDDVKFPAGVARLVDDRELDHSYLNGIEAVPTLIRFEGGREVERVMGWDRAAWQRLTGIADLGAEYPALRPG